jgi:hypothetical protein
MAKEKWSAGDLPIPTAEERASHSEIDEDDSEPSSQMSLGETE